MTEDDKGRILAGAVLAGVFWVATRGRARARSTEGATAVPAGGAVPAAPVNGEANGLTARIEGGERDENALTDFVFFGRHPERQYQPIGAGEKQLAAEWLAIRDQVVRPALAWVGGGGASGTF